MTTPTSAARGPGHLGESPATPGRHPAVGYGLLLASATGFGLMPIFAVWAYTAGVNVTTLLFYRFALAALALGAALAATGRLIRPRPRDLGLMALLGGVLYAAMSTLYFSAVQLISPALTSLLLYLYPGLVAAAAAVFAKERHSWRIVASLLLSFAGVALAVGRVEVGGNAMGVLLGACAPVVYTAYILIGDRISASVPPLLVTTHVCVFAAASFGVVGLATGQLRLELPREAWGPTVAVALASTVLAVGGFFAGMAQVGPTRASIVSTIEPVVSIVAALALLGGSMSATQAVGAVLVVTGAALGALAGHPGRGAPAKT